jgi:hypothetical protein
MAWREHRLAILLLKWNIPVVISDQEAGHLKRVRSLVFSGPTYISLDRNISQDHDLIFTSKSALKVTCLISLCSGGSDVRWTKTL